MFSFGCALPSPTSAEGFPSLFGWFTGITAQSDFSSTCMSVVRLVAFTDRPRSSDQGVLEISRFSCMLFRSVRGFYRLRRTGQPLAITQLPYCLPPTHQGVGILICDFSKLNHPAHRCLDLRFATHLAMCHARLEVRMDSLFPFLQGLAPLQHVGLSRRTVSRRRCFPNAGQSLPRPLGRPKSSLAPR